MIDSKLLIFNQLLGWTKKCSVTKVLYNTLYSYRPPYKDLY